LNGVRVKNIATPNCEARSSTATRPDWRNKATICDWRLLEAREDEEVAMSRDPTSAKD
jgi:hypothetical protein